MNFRIAFLISLSLLIGVPGLTVAADRDANTSDSIPFKKPASIDAIMNASESPTKVGINTPYSMDELIKGIPESLDDNGVYKGGWLKYDDPRAIALDKELFGDCDDFYIRMNGKSGGAIIDSTLRYLFPESEGSKVNASVGIKNSFSSLRSLHGCTSRDQYIEKIQQIANLFIKSAPGIYQEKINHVATAKGERIKKEETERAQEKMIADAKKRDDDDRLAKIADEEKRVREKRESDSNMFNVFLLLVGVVGAFIWHKYFRRRCPKCKATSPNLVEEAELESWIGTKQVSEKLANGKSQAKTVNTTFSKVQRSYKCAACDHVWSEVSKEEK